MSKDYSNYLVSNTETLPNTMQRMDNIGNGIVFVVNNERKLLGVITDGDIRRWLLQNGSIETNVEVIMNRNPKFLRERDTEIISYYLNDLLLRAVPIVDDDMKIIDVVSDKRQHAVSDALKNALNGIPAVIMAGGMGSRLYPYTKILPKPLIPIGEIPIVERVMDGLNEYGIDKFYMTVFYKKNMIQSYFADSEKDYAINYIEENKPLGTAGSIKLISDIIEKPLIVANCDSLIRADYADMYRCHIENENAITVVTALKNDKIPYGVITSGANGEIERIDEKPTRSYLINTGMYIINPDIISIIPDNEVFHMTHLVEKAQAHGYRIGMYPVSEDSFLDMGEFEGMRRMEEKLNIQ